MTANWPTSKKKQIQRGRASLPKYPTIENGGREHSSLLRVHDDLVKQLVKLMADRATEATP